MVWSNYWRDFLIDHIARTDGTLPTTFHFALFTTAPNFLTGLGGTECSGTGYGRIGVARSTANFDASLGGNGATQNTNEIQFSASANSDWGTIVAAGVYDAATLGNFLWGANLASSKVVNNGDPVSIPAGDADFSLPNA